MKRLGLMTLALGLVTASHAAQIVAEYDWQKLADAGQVRKGTPMILDGKSVLKVSNTNQGDLKIAILTIAAPPITNSTYAFKGDVKCAGVGGDGYLEMLNYFPSAEAGRPESAYFSRTLAASGEMGKLSGNQEWRKFQLPFDRSGTSNPPNRLEISVYLPGPGTVYLGAAQLLQPAPMLTQKGNVEGAWWSDRASGLIGGLAGGIGGCFGGLLTLLAARGQMRGLVLNGTKVLIGVGALSGMLGVTALLFKQPYHVWFVLLLLGVLLVGILTPRLRQYQRLFADRELRRMRAADSLSL